MYLKVKVKTGEKKAELKDGSKPLSYLLSVKEVPRDNLANAAVLSRLAKHLGVPVKKLRIVSGHHKPNKIIEVMG